MTTAFPLCHDTSARQAIVDYVPVTEHKSAMALFSQLQVASREKKLEEKPSLYVSTT